MRLFLLPLLSASLLLVKGCDLNDMAGKKPEQIQHAAEQQLAPYFPKAKVVVSEEQRTILGMTCVANVGKAFLEQMVPVLERSEGVRQLKEYRANYAGLEGLSRMLGMKLVTYRYFSLGFDQYVIRLDADTQQHSILPTEQFAHYAEHLIGKLRIQRRRRFIEQHHLGLHGQGARDRHALLLPSR